ncbi:MULTISPECIES: sporulation integral membrane protein YtvI [Paenibacillus]|jgi:sporulation integral membrane protein YtvI|uniref:Sporulation integral membrane protein YtvI n=2 Tax=Paenibacillus TaxID=44249 RepID=A0ABT2URI7_9BACL|nr:MULTISPECIES: sporulation integral membrane protein YtvI [unclassified Paenibacillus]MCU6797267.1 sporulation integral membrane protein YtvI [Paenibacillus sp. WQ 127069]OMF14079.1 sporulation integral membrane protein YtvI [Paenibacillus sp. FSL H7-0331]
MSLRMILFVTLGVLLLYGMFTIGFPFMLALLVAILLEQPIQWLMKLTRMSREWAAGVICSLFTAGVLGFFYLLGFKMVSELIQFWRNAPEYLNEAQLFFDMTSEKTQIFYTTLPDGLAAQLQAWTEAGINTISENLKEIITAVSVYFLDIAKTIPNLFIFSAVFVIGLYLISLSLPALYQSFVGIFEGKSQPKIISVLYDLRKALFGFIFAQVLISFLTYFVTLIGLLFLRTEYPLAIALLIVAVDVLPVLGTSVVLVPWALYSILSGNVSLGVGLLILLVVIMLFRRLVEPKIIGNAVGINALATLISMYIGFKLVGVIGLILGPSLIIVYMALRRVGVMKLSIKL